MQTTMLMNSNIFSKYPATQSRQPVQKGLFPVLQTPERNIAHGGRGSNGKETEVERD
jgi:hypothetical protein